MATYFDLFFEEKDLPYRCWEIDDGAGFMHIIDSETVIEKIKSAPASEQKVIRDTLVRIDFVNGDVMHYLRFLAGAFVKTYTQAGREG
jgi:hypothetical protein